MESFQQSQVCVDLTGIWTINTTSNDTPITLPQLTIIEPATSWFFITPLHNKESETVATAFDPEWRCKYHHPLQCIHRKGAEFRHGFQQNFSSHGIQDLITIVANLQANAVIEHINQVIANMPCTSSSITIQEINCALFCNLMQHNEQYIQLIIRHSKHHQHKWFLVLI